MITSLTGVKLNSRAACKTLICPNVSFTVAPKGVEGLVKLMGAGASGYRIHVLLILVPVCNHSTTSLL